MKFQVGQAAKLTGKTRQAIHLAIKKGRLSASRSDKNAPWEIDAAELFRVYDIDKENNPEFTLLDTLEIPESASSNDKLNELTAKLEAQQELIQELRNQNADLREQRDSWQRDAEAWRQKALPQGQVKPGFFARFFGRA